MTAETSTMDETKQGPGRPSKADLEERERVLAEREAEVIQREKQAEMALTGIDPDTGEKVILHRRNCPQLEKPDVGRIEIVRGWRPADRDKGIVAHETEIKRCMDCGRQVGIKGDVREDG